MSKIQFSRLHFRIVLFLAILFWCAGFLFIQFFPSFSYNVVFYPFLKFMYSIVCHQQSGKCFEINGMHLFVCARCTGLYAGALLASAFSVFSFRQIYISFKIIIISFIPLAVDVLMYNLGIYDYSKTIAFISSIFSGSVVFLYILSELKNFFFESKYDLSGIRLNEQK